jgi:hypothetical protein
MKVIGDRISILKKENLLSIVILPTADKKKLAFLFLWLLAWSVCGVIVFINYFKITLEDAKVFIIVYLAFWAYYEIKIIRAFLWKKWGKEKLWVKNNIIHYQREINGKGKIHEFNLDVVSDLKLIEISHASFSDFFYQSFWVKGGERLTFTCFDKQVKFGMQLSTEEARAVLSEVKKVF